MNPPNEADIVRNKAKIKLDSGCFDFTTSSNYFFRDPRSHYKKVLSRPATSLKGSKSLPALDKISLTSSELFHDGTNRETVWIRGDDHVRNNKSSDVRLVLEPLTTTKQFVKQARRTCSVGVGTSNTGLSEYALSQSGLSNSRSRKSHDSNLTCSTLAPSSCSSNTRVRALRSTLSEASLIQKAPEFKAVDFDGSRTATKS